MKAKRKIRKKGYEPVNEELNKYDIVPLIYGSVKSYASIYGKMMDRNKSFKEILDLYAI